MSHAVEYETGGNLVCQEQTIYRALFISSIRNSEELVGFDACKSNKTIASNDVNVLFLSVDKAPFKFNTAA